MGFLSCYTLNEKVVDGIRVDAFECINTESTSTTRIDKAVLEFIPLLPCDTDDTSVIASRSLTFLNEPTKNDKKDDAGVIISFNPDEWRLCYNASLYTLIDPCGVHGDVILFVRTGAKNVLTKTKDRNVVLSISDDNKPVIEKCRRAALIYGIAKGLLLEQNLNKLPAQNRKVPSKKTSKSARS